MDVRSVFQLVWGMAFLTFWVGYVVGSWVNPPLCHHRNVSEHPKYAIDDEPGHWLCLDCGDKFPLIGDTDKWEAKPLMQVREPCR